MPNFEVRNLRNEICELKKHLQSLEERVGRPNFINPCPSFYIHLTDYPATGIFEKIERIYNHLEIKEKTIKATSEKTILVKTK